MFSISGLNQLTTINNLKNSQLNASFEKLSTGKAINSAADDSAGLQISTRLTSSLHAHSQVNRNLNDGISYAQIAEGGLQESAALLQRMRQLAIQSQSGINSVSDRNALDKEFQQLKNAINTLAYNTEAFNRLPLVGDEDLLSENVPSLSDAFVNGAATTMSSGLRSIAYIPAGSVNITINLNDFGADDDIQVFTPSGEHLIGTPLSDSAWGSNSVTTPSDVESELFNTENGYSSNAAYDDSQLLLAGVATIGGTTFTFSGDQKPSSNFESLHIDSTTQPLIISVIGSGFFSATASWDSLGEPGLNSNGYSLGDVNITASNQLVEGTRYIGVEKTPATLEALDIVATAITSEQAANDALERIDTALAAVSESRAFYGAKVNQMSSAYRLNMGMSEHVAASYSRITDTDYAKETAQLTQNQIVEQASVSLLAQANTGNERVLDLLNTTVE